MYLKMNKSDIFTDIEITSDWYHAIFSLYILDYLDLHSAGAATRRDPTHQIKLLK